MALLEKEGEVSFEVPNAGKECKTWYKIYGDLSGGITPVLVLHGGPGVCHEYLLTYTELSKRFGIPTIFYDQIGNGRGTRFPEKNGDDSFWTVKLFIDELGNLIRHLGLDKTGYDILGHSWGGMLAGSFAVTQPLGLRRLVLSGTPASVADWEMANLELMKRLPKKVRETIEQTEATGKVGSDEHQAAVREFSQRHLCKVEPFPCPEVKVGLDHIAQDPTTFGTMKGFALIRIAGSLKRWSIKDRLQNIDVPVLLLNGVDDQAADSVMLPLFQSIRKVKWVTIDNASHYHHVEQPEKVVDIVSKFLRIKSDVVTA